MVRTFLFLLFGIYVLVSPIEKLMALDFADLKSRALAIRNTDPEVERIGEWNKVLEELDQYARSADIEKCEAFFTLGNLCSDFYLKRGGEGRIECAIDSFQKIGKECPDHLLAPEALLAIADLKSAKGGSGKAEYMALLNRYPTSSAAVVANQRVTEKAGPPRSERASMRHEVPGDKVIVVDPGHGGDDHGAYSDSGLLEKDIALDVAKRMARILGESQGLQVQMTREGDAFVPLSRRTALANALKADLFLSIHVNASPHGKSSGIETYYLDNTDDLASMKLAERENGDLSAHSAEEVDLAFLVSDLVQSAKLDESIALAKSVQSRLVRDLKSKYPFVKDLGVKRAPFYVLTGAHMPCALVELFFVNNKKDAAHLADPEFREAIARSLASAAIERVMK